MWRRRSSSRSAGLCSTASTPASAKSSISSWQRRCRCCSGRSFSVAWTTSSRSSSRVSEPVLVRACRLEQVERTPVWFMRQAGRSLPEYRKLRESYGLFDIARQPELCAEVTLQPVRRLGVDAAVMFADIMLPVIGIGVGVELVDNVGPVVAQPIKGMADLDVLRPIEPEEDVPFVMEA